MDKVLEISNIDFGYDKENLLYRDFSLSLERGEIKAIVGPSGAGKTTLFELILSELKPITGKIDALRISEVFQDPYTSFHPAYSIRNQIEDVASLKGIGDYLEEMKLDPSFLDKLPHELSGGQLQRSSILRALLMKPDLLLLDEPTSALDNVIQLEVMQMLLGHLDVMGMLLITHEIDLAKWCADEIVEIGRQ
ncbi:MAG: peptide ABC transporter ATP-binding protein [Helicobacteraceae bacterium 4484_230]|nr:MAG: peptide ABC transporter ATP-binding protein [Helicobacteraceae bacterium 4484_230]